MGALLLDLYDTLVWCDWPKFRREWAARTGVGPDQLERALWETRAARNTGRLGDATEAMRALLTACALDPRPELVDDLTEWEARFVAEEVTLHDEVLDALARFRQDGWRLALVSNCSYNTRPVVESLGLAERMDALVLSCEAGTAKPEPQIFRIALEAVGARPEEAVFVDDDPAYLEGARRVGIRPVRMARRTGFAAPRDDDNFPVVTDLEALERWLLTER